MNPNIFRAYDIRGVADTDLNSDVAKAIGRALGTMARRRGAETFAVGRDCRLSGPRVRADLVEGLVSTGLHVIDVGEVPTPLLYFSVFHRNYGGGVQVTGSHNPPEFNGFKSMIGKSTLHGDEIQELRELIEAGDFVTGEGSLSSDPIQADYIDWVAANIELGPRKLSVVVDGGNGVAGPTACELYRRLGVEVFERFIEPDGRFPNHHPDPTTVETVEIMREHVLETHADLALGFDGDGDRIGVVDGDGNVQWGDRLMIVLAREVLAAQPGATIVSEVKCSKTLYDDIAKHGGVGI
ncbi:MAG: phosphomannomutase/phosphoglucomutase, partial [Myxococcales bacterium]|nr:phosphomannomutase/phosphoglucomutase [Myxococcales bacterium]